MSIFADTLSFIQAPQAEAYESLALRVFQFQVEGVPAYGAYVKSLGIEPADVRQIHEIPAVSTLAFKYAPMESATEAPSADARLFLTSGTTHGRDERGRHLVLHPEIYRASALNHLRRMLFPDGRETAMLALHPVAERMPESSLSQMISWCIEEFGTATQTCVATREGIDVESAINFLRQCETSGEPVCIIGTTAACVRLFEAATEYAIPIRLGGDSRLMDTGGAKGQALPISAADVIEQATRLLGINRAMVINEYGMTEMCSQLYDATSFNSHRSDNAETRVKLGPPWLMPLAFDPATLRAISTDKFGLLGFFDLANVGSVSMIVTEDLGTVDAAGGVRIEGRAASAGARGCALSIKEFAEREHRAGS